MRLTSLSIPLCLAAALGACTRTPEPTMPSTAVVATPTETAPPAPEVDRERPTLQIATLDGTPYDLATHRGRWIVVNFWATWCAPCIKEMPELDEFDKRREDAEVIGLAYEDIEPDDLRAFLTKRPVSYPIAIVDVTDPPQAFDTPRGLPMTHLIAPDGRLAKSFLGPVTAADLDKAIDEAGPAS
ncbi:TlpA family protein disulfide reductase [Cognatilysobacter bugurensis]|uniref:Thioredoxin n=1 Tax=Cognatilysobacter bugurensis TaxID=543356 RepID=A0A918T3Q4_9GAMM|nr:thioredoxin [Lysobacter bugurensis]